MNVIHYHFQTSTPLNGQEGQISLGQKILLLSLLDLHAIKWSGIAKELKVKRTYSSLFYSYVCGFSCCLTHI